MPNLIDKVQTKEGLAQINYNGLANKPDLTPYIGEFTLDTTQKAVTLTAGITYDNIKTAFENGRTVLLKDTDTAEFYALAKAETASFTFSSVGKYISISQDNSVIYTEKSNGEYTAANGIEIIDNSIELEYGKIKEQNGQIAVWGGALNSNSKASYNYFSEALNEWRFGDADFFQGMELAPDTPLRFYIYDNAQNKILVSDWQKGQFFLSEDDGVSLFGINIQETNLIGTDRKLITTYTVKDSSIPVSGIAILSNYGDLQTSPLNSISAFCSMSADLDVTFVIEKQWNKRATIPEEMIEYGQTQDQIYYYGTNYNELITLDERILQQIPQIYYSNKDKEFDNVFEDKLYTFQQPASDENLTFSFYHNYDFNHLYIMPSDGSDFIVAAWETTNVSNIIQRFQSFLNNKSLSLYLNYEGTQSIYLYSDRNVLTSIHFYRHNITETLDDILTNLTWTPADTERKSALLALMTFNNGSQVIIPLIRAEDALNTSSSYRCGFIFGGTSRQIQIKKAFTVDVLPIYPSSTSPSASDLKEASEVILTGEQSRELVLSALSDYKPSVSLATYLTAEGEDAYKPVTNQAITNRFQQISDDLPAQISNTIANSKINYSNIEGAPSIPTAAEIQNSMSYDTVPTASSNNLLTSGSIYNLQQSLVESINGKAKGYVFDTNSELQTWLSNSDNKAQLKIGDVLYIRETGYPDYWWDGTQTQYLETQKVDLTDYLKKTDAASTYATQSEVSNKVINSIFNAEVTSADWITLSNTKNSTIDCTFLERFIPSFGYGKYAMRETSSTLVNITYDAENPSTSGTLCYFTFNQQKRKNVTFLPESSTGGYYESDITPYIFNNISTGEIKCVWLVLYVETYVSNSTPSKGYIKRFDISTADIAIADSTPTAATASENTITFVKEST